MKIAVVLRRFNKEGGIERYVVEVTERFLKNNEVHLITTWYKNKIDGLNVHMYPLISKPYFLQIGLNAIKNTLAIRNLKKKIGFDIVYSQGAESLETDAVVMQSCHRAVVEQFKRERGILYKILKNIDPLTNVTLFIEKYVIEKGSKKIIAISNIVKQEIVRYYSVPEEKISVIYSGVNIDEFNPENKIKFRDEIRSKCGISKDDTLLIFVGHEFRRKGVEYIIKAVKLLDKNVKLLVIGKDNLELYKEIARTLGIEDRIIFIGHSADVKKYYAASDIFVFPSLYEPFGLVITEAMASGLPVIVSKMAGASEIIKDGYDGLLLKNPRNPDEIAEKIRILLDKELSKKMGENARKTAENYTWDRVVRETLDIFSDILNSEKK